jgi:regulator of RNase E activity RraA
MHAGHLHRHVDGVVVVPRKIEEKALTLAFKKVASENTVRAELKRGDRLRAVFARHGIL